MFKPRAHRCSSVLMRRLLTHLAQFGSLFKQGELLCTQSLAYLLENADARRAFASHISARAGVTVSDDLRWRAEARQADLGRPDLEGCTADRKPVVKIEAKLGAAFSSGQLTSYIDDFQNRGALGQLMLLVPSHRTRDATETVWNALGVEGDVPWRLPARLACSVAVTSWEAAIDALRGVHADAFQADLEQFEAMYRVLKGYNLEPVLSALELKVWREREPVFVTLVERVTRRFARDGRVLPMGHERDTRQLSTSLRLPTARHRTPLLQRGSPRIHSRATTPPIWLRFRYDTPMFGVIRERLMSSSLTTPPVESGGHIWIALNVPLEVGGDGLIDVFANKIEDVAQVAYQPLSS